MSDMKFMMIFQGVDRASKVMKKLMQAEKATAAAVKGNQRSAQAAQKAATAATNRQVSALARVKSAARGAFTSVQNGAAAATRKVVALYRATERLGRNGMQRVRDGAGRLTRGVGLAVGLGASVAGAALLAASQMVDVAAKFEKYETILTQTEGSSKRAKQAMAWVSEFAVKTPYELDQVMESFVKLRAYGLDPTTGLLRDLGDMSAAMGKPLEQAVEAIADAMTGENERLKEFGIRAAVEGNKIAYAYTVNGQRKIVSALKDDPAGIEKALRTIMVERYGGAMDKLAQTWDGMTSNMWDLWTSVQRKIMSAGLFDYMKSKLQLVLDTVNAMAANGSLDAWAKLVSDRIVLVLEATWRFATGAYGILEKLGGYLSIAADYAGGWENLAYVIGAIAFAPMLITTAAGLMQIVLGLSMIAMSPAGLALAGIAALAWLLVDDWGAAFKWIADKVIGIVSAFGKLKALIREIFADPGQALSKLFAFDWGNVIPALSWALFIPALLWPRFVARLAWRALIKPLVWNLLIKRLGWKSFAPRLIWSAIVTRLRWLSFVPRLSWSAFVAPLRWASVAARFAWSTVLTPLRWLSFVPRLSWPAFVTPLRWASVVARFAWSTVLTPLRWLSFVPKLSWSGIAGRLSWSALITPLRWGLRFIPYIGWALLAGELLWSMLIKPLGWDKYISIDGLKALWGKVTAFFSGFEWPALPSFDLPQLPDIAGWIAGVGDKALSAIESVTTRIGAAWGKIKSAFTFGSATTPELNVADPATIMASQAAVASLKADMQSVTSINTGPAMAQLGVLEAAGARVKASIISSLMQAQAYVSNLSFYNQGAALMDTMAAGIRARAGAVTAEIQKMAQQVRNMLPSSPAKTGPLSDIHRLKFGETIASSIRAEPMLKAMRAATAATMAAATPVAPAFAATSIPQAAMAAAPKVAEPRIASQPPADVVRAKVAQMRVASAAPMAIKIDYKPTISITGDAKTAQADFARQLQEHSREIEKLVDEAARRASRRTY